MHSELLAIAALTIFFRLLIAAEVHPRHNKEAMAAVALSVSSVSCICVPKDMCEDKDEDAGVSEFMDIRFADESNCANYLHICCENPRKHNTSKTPVTTPHPTTTTQPTCGYEHPMGMDTRITQGGTKAIFGEMPWTTIILLKKSGQNIYQCGGSLINYKAVLTAAHCVYDTLDGTWTVRVGEWNTRTQDEPLPHQDRSVEEIVLHPQYNPSSLRNDLALLFLDEPVILAENVAIICLPSSEHHLLEARCFASGWGKDAFKEGKYSSVLKKIELPIVPPDECLQALRATRLGKFYQLDKSFLCAGGEANRDTCKGDGGSPLVCPIPGHPGRWMQMGIVSWGIGCGTMRTPGVYANVALHRGWMDAQLQARGLDPTLYKYE